MYVHGHINDIIAGKVTDDPQHPGKEHQQSQGHAKHFGNEDQGHFVDLGGGLKNAHQDADDQAHQQLVMNSGVTATPPTY
jgi:hypothetical protein